MNATKYSYSHLRIGIFPLLLALSSSAVAGITTDGLSPVSPTSPCNLYADQILRNMCEVQASLRALSQRVAALEDENIALISQVRALEEKTASLSYDTDGAYPEVVFTGVNVRVINGLGCTAEDAFDSTCASNGMGNLILGYNASRTDYASMFNDTRTGSHNLVIGDFNDYQSTAGAVFGRWNASQASGASVLGGYANKASERDAVVVTGKSNTASGEFAAILAGYNNSATAEYAAITAGKFNEATGEASSICGGQFGVASGYAAAVDGGYGNEAVDYYSAVSGGYYNVADGDNSTVSGGANRETNNTNDWVAGSLSEDD